MSNPSVDPIAVQKAFDDVAIIKGQTISFATVDAEGNPNVAQSVANLEANPKAAFSVTLRPRLRDVFSAKEGKTAMGYRVYCRYTGADDSQEAMEQEYVQILKRIPFFMRRPFLKFCRQNLKRVLKFEVTGIREV